MASKSIAIAPSILAADFGRLAEEVRATEQNGADRVHIDVMDGHFVPNLSMGSVVVRGLRDKTPLPLEVHLMVERPEKFASGFLEAGADTLIFHIEVTDEPRPLMAQIQGQGKQVGLAVNPETDLSKIEPFLEEVDLALCMTVHPGFGGQAFIEQSIEKIAALREMIDRLNPDCELEVDGGIDENNGVRSVRAGANVLVVGTALFGHAEGPGRATKLLCEKVASL